MQHSRGPRRLASVLVALLLALLLVPLAAAPALACSCVGWTEAEALAAADVAFTGRAVSTTEPASGLFGSLFGDAPVTTTFVVETVHKGQVHESTRISTATDGAACGLEFIADTRYVVFASYGGDGAARLQSDELGANLCNGTRAEDEQPLAVGASEPPLRGSDSRSGPAFPAVGWLSLFGVAGLAAFTAALWLRLVRSSRLSLG